MRFKVGMFPTSNFPDVKVYTYTIPVYTLYWSENSLTSAIQYLKIVLKMFCIL